MFVEKLQAFELNSLIKTGYLLVALVISVSQDACSITSVDDQFVKEFKHLIDKARQKFDVPGVAVGLIKDGSVILLEGFGNRSLKNKEPMNPDTLFQIASISKTFVAAAVLKLESEGKLSLDSPVSSVSPMYAFKDGHLRKQLRLKHILSHTSGLAADLWHTEFQRGVSYTKFLGLLKDQPFVSKPGTEYGYQNILFGIFEHSFNKSGYISWADYLDHNIFRPLKMLSPLAKPEIYNQEKNRATPYRKKRSNPLEVYEALPSKFGWATGPAAGLVMSTRDLVVWVRCMMNKGILDGVRIMDSKIFDKMTKIRIPVPRSAVAQGFHWFFPKERVHEISYGYGVRLHDWNGNKVVMHDGFLRGQRSHFSYMPEKNIGIVVLSNMVSPLPEVLRSYYFDRVLGLNGIDWATHAMDKTL